MSDDLDSIPNIVCPPPLYYCGRAIPVKERRRCNRRLSNLVHSSSRHLNPISEASRQHWQALLRPTTDLQTTTATEKTHESELDDRTLEEKSHFPLLSAISRETESLDSTSRLVGVDKILDSNASDPSFRNQRVHVHKVVDVASQTDAEVGKKARTKLLADTQCRKEKRRHEQSSRKFGSRCGGNKSRGFDRQCCRLNPSQVFTRSRTLWGTSAGVQRESNSREGENSRKFQTNASKNTISKSSRTHVDGELQ